ncbi:MAG: hypothetical protein MET45_27755 [Nostoc sp. LLA-1]|nr:hypothetical protein [Cyanocohniella sp. LLY]
MRYTLCRQYQISGLVRFNLFTTITTLGTPHDILLQELRIKSWFPADKMTEMNLRTGEWGIK